MARTSLALVGGKPLAGKFLSERDLVCRHFARKLDAAGKSGAIAAERGQVEPFMRNHEVRLHIEAGRIQHPELEQCICATRLRRHLKPIDA